MIEGMPLPLPDLDTKLFWDGCDGGRFLYQRCTGCLRSRWPPGPMCPHCQSSDTEWIESAGHGRVYSWVVVTHPVDPVLVDQVPYVVAMIDLEEGIRVVGNVAGCEPHDIHGDMPVELYFEDLGSGRRLPNFRKS